jgi:hypothetical protein
VQACGHQNHGVPRRIVQRPVASGVDESAKRVDDPAAHKQRYHPWRQDRNQGWENSEYHPAVHKIEDHEDDCIARAKP